MPPLPLFPLPVHQFEAPPDTPLITLPQGRKMQALRKARNRARKSDVMKIMVMMDIKRVGEADREGGGGRERRSRKMKRKKWGRKRR